MELYIGGYAQGKLNYVLQRYTDESCLVYDAEFPEKEENGNGEKIIINHLHQWIKRQVEMGGNPEDEIEKYVEKHRDIVIISDEIGNGIVPVDVLEREYRERTGRILVRLASGADEVVRVICGIGQKIK